MQTASVEEAAVSTAVPNLSLIPSTLDLLGVEMEISHAADRATRLRKAFRGNRIVSVFLYID